MRNVHALNNTIDRPMVRLADGGGLYTNTPCPGCNVSGNVFSNDGTVYGCLYHDGGSGEWYDVDNVFNHIHTPVVFGHGSCPNIVATDVWMNDSSAPKLQGASNNLLQNAAGVCQDAVFNAPPKGQFWSEWPVGAAAIVANAGRRGGPLPPPIAPALSPPAPEAIPGGKCIRFASLPCVAGKPSQKWFLDDGVKPGDGKLTAVRSGITTNSSTFSCWKPQFNFVKNKNTCQLHSSEIDCSTGCSPISSSTQCSKSNGWSFNANGTITNGETNTVGNGNSTHEVTLCLTKGDTHGAGTAVSVAICSGAPNQQWKVTSGGSDGSYTISQNATCVDNNYKKADAMTL
jgi:hypothetical protein